MAGHQATRPPVVANYSAHEIKGVMVDLRVYHQSEEEETRQVLTSHGSNLKESWLRPPLDFYSYVDALQSTKQAW